VSWNLCSAHGEFDGRKAWGCPDCVVEMRRMLRRIKAQFQNAGNCPFCGEVDFNVTVGGKRQAAFGEHAKDCPYDDLMKMKLER
jgi:hypothetical protein